MSVHGSTVSRLAGRPRRGLLLALTLALSGLAAATPAAIRPPEATGPAGRADSPGQAVVGGVDLRVLQSRQVSMDEAIEMAQRRHNARVVRAEVTERDGRRVYVLRLLSEDGRVFNVRVDAATGSMR